MTVTRRHIIATLGTAVPCAIAAPAAAISATRLLQENQTMNAIAKAIDFERANDSAALFNLTRMIEEEPRAYARYDLLSDRAEETEVDMIEVEKNGRGPVVYAFHKVFAPLGRRPGMELDRFDESASIALSELKYHLECDRVDASLVEGFEARVNEDRAALKVAVAEVEAMPEYAAWREADDAACVALKELDRVRCDILRHPARTPAEFELKASWMARTFGKDRPEGMIPFEEDYADALLESFIR